MPGLFEEKHTEKSDQDSSSATASKLPKGVVLDKDGKPCRTCTSSAAWMSMMKSSASPKTQSSNNSNTMTSTNPFASIQQSQQQQTQQSVQSITSSSDCPADVEELGRSTWTFLHTLTATYPETPSSSMQSTTRQFISLFSKLYPCWVCADDFQAWLAKPENEPQLASQDLFGRWMCKAHNEVNRKLGKKEFDCDLWKERWRDGWKDGRCE